MIAVLPREDFEALEAVGPGGAHAAALAEARAAGFAEGFEAGRRFTLQEADTAQQDARERALAVLERLDFTHAEARAHVLASLLPFVEAVAGRLLPALADRGLPALVAQEVAALTVGAVPGSLSLRAGSGVAPLLHALDLPAGLALATDPDLPETTVVIAAGAAGTGIDLADAARRILSLLDATARNVTADRKGHLRNG